MSELPDNCVQCVITSPPYWGLRKYAGNQDLVWGDNHCQHEWGSEIISQANDSNRGSMEWATGGNPATKVLGQRVSQGHYCSLCGAWRGQLGLEPTPELYIQHLIEILREIKRVLRPDGVVFWNIGDSYAHNGACGGSSPDGPRKPRETDREAQAQMKYHVPPGLKAKDLCLIPERFALAAQVDGWYIRSRICWNKPNPMPESVRDRPTDSWEHIWMLTKSARYYYDNEAVKEVADTPLDCKASQTFGAPGGKAEIAYGHKVSGEKWVNNGGRNLRSVWTFPTQPYKNAHFATFPEELPERCIKAGTSEKGCCPKCGKPWTRVVEKVPCPHDGYTEDKNLDPQANGRRIALMRQAARERGHEYVNETKTLGWQPACQCDAGEPVPCLILDPFMGSGTSLKVAAELGRRSVGYEISEEYCQLAIDRNKQAVLI